MIDNRYKSLSKNKVFQVFCLLSLPILYVLTVSAIVVLTILDVTAPLTRKISLFVASRRYLSPFLL